MNQGELTLEQLNKKYNTKYEADSFITVSEEIENDKTRYTLYVKSGGKYFPNGVQEVLRGQPCTFNFNTDMV